MITPVSPVSPVGGKPNLLLGAYEVDALGYRAEEFFVSGTASSYTADEQADYTTRVVVLTPTDHAAFNGTVIVEWLNVSGGIDAPAVWLMAHREIAREGYAYVAVSAQRVGVEGGVSLVGADMSLKAQDPARYSELIHPGDAFAYDIFSQVGSVVRNGLLGRLEPKAVLAVGESQSAAYLTTYVNDVDPLAGVYDGFLVHSRFGPAAPLDGSSVYDASKPDAPKEFRGGNSRHTRNLRSMHDAPTDLLTGAYSEDEFVTDLLRVTGGRTNETLARLVVRESAGCAA